MALPAVPAVSVPVCAPTATVPTDFATTRFAVPVRSPFPWQFDCRAAVTVNVVVPGGVTPVVATVSDVLGLSPLVPVRLVLPNVAVAPAGSPLALKSRVHSPSLPAIGTVTVYSALDPARRSGSQARSEPTADLRP